MTPCIYCGNPADAREHWLPRGLGNFRGCTPLVDRLCERCNRELGHELDEELLRTGPVAFNRAVLGVRGRRKHRPVNPFHFRAGSAQQPTSLRMKSLYGDYDILAEAFLRPDGEQSAKYLRQLVLRKDGAIHCLPFPPAWDGEQLKAALAKRNMQDAELVEVYLGEDEGPESMRIREVMTAAFGKFSVMARYGLTPESVKSTVQLEAGITGRYIRALAKIAFHYALWAVPSLTGREPHLRPLRDYVRWGVGEHRHFVQMAAPQFVAPLTRGRVPAVTCHCFCAEVGPRGASASVQLFVRKGHVLPPARVLLSSGRCGDTQTNRGHTIKMYPKSDGEFDGELIADRSS